MTMRPLHGLTTGLLLAASVLAPGVTHAQSPWKVTLIPTLDPLPIGLCAAIQIKLVDAAGVDVPRNARGTRVTIADFDIAVTAPDGKSVAAQRIDDSHWSACACQGAAEGTVGTVTATYPAARLDARARVPDVAFQTTAPFTVAAAKGAVNPPACLTAAASEASRGAGGIAAEGLASAVPPPPGQPAASVPAPLAPYSPLDVTVETTFKADGSWLEQSEVTVSFALNATGSWSDPDQVTVTFDLSAIGSWVGAPAANFTIP